MRKFLLSIISMIISIPLYGQFVTNVSKVGTTSAQFLKIEVGPRAIGMGGAFVAVANDASTIYWNPAGLVRLKKNEVILTHTDWLADTNFDFAGMVFHLGRFGTLATSITTLNMAEMEVRTVFYPEGTGEKFDCGDLAAGISYARNLTDRFSIGFNAKYIRQTIWHMAASSIAFDIGTLFTTQFNQMKIGMSISNFGNKMRYEGKDTRIFYDFDPQKFGDNDRLPAYLQTDKWALPLMFRVGVAMDVLKSLPHRLTVAVDANHPNDNTENINLGGEYVFKDWVSLRLGYKSLFTRDSEEGLTAGAGLKYPLRYATLKIDYAYADFGRLTSVHRFAISIEF